MIEVSRIIARVAELRQEAATKGLSDPNRDRPEFGYGEVVGRDYAFALVLEAINTMLEQDAKDEEER